ncbi:MAG: 50S ribosomal protein L18e [Candidatus Woesearchaeota archaeon]
MAKRTGSTNPLLKGLIQELRKKANEHGCNIWKRVADDLEKPSRQRRIVNLYKINKFTKENETVIVPGKVLSVGDLDHNVTVAAFTFSGSALDKINKKGKAVTINELIQEDPKGKRIRILG